MTWGVENAKLWQLVISYSDIGACLFVCLFVCLLLFVETNNKKTNQTHAGTEIVRTICVEKTTTKVKVIKSFFY